MASVNLNNDPEEPKTGLHVRSVKNDQISSLIKASSKFYLKIGNIISISVKISERCFFTTTVKNGNLP